MRARVCAAHIAAVFARVPLQLQCPSFTLSDTLLFALVCACVLQATKRRIQQQMAVFGISPTQQDQHGHGHGQNETQSFRMTTESEASGDDEEEDVSGEAGGREDEEEAALAAELRWSDVAHESLLAL